MDGDYVLETHDEEIDRLGVQHLVWRPVMLADFAAADRDRDTVMLTPLVLEIRAVRA